MSKLVIRYYYQNTKDKAENFIFLNNDKYGLVELREIKTFMLQNKFINENCYLRFKDHIGDCYSWIDIKNDKSPFPINDNNEVLIKILQTPYKVINLTHTKKQQAKTQQDIIDPFEENDLIHEQHKFEKSKSVNPNNIQNELIQENKVNKKHSDSFDFLDNDHEENKVNIQKNKNTNNDQNIDNDLLNFKLTESNINKTTSRHKTDKIELDEKMSHAQIIEPKIKQWAYQNNIRKDVRTLLSTCHELLWDDFTKWKKITIIDIIDDTSLNRKIKQARIIFHPDKNRSLKAGQLYLLERIFSEINDSFKHYRDNKQ